MTQFACLILCSFLSNAKWLFFSQRYWLGIGNRQSINELVKETEMEIAVVAAAAALEYESMS